MQKALHLTALGDDDVLIRLLSSRTHVLDLPNDVHAIDNPAEDNVLVVQERRRNGSDEELASIRVWTGILRSSQLTRTDDGWKAGSTYGHTQ